MYKDVLQYKDSQTHWPMHALASSYVECGGRRVGTRHISFFLTTISTEFPVRLTE